MYAHILDNTIVEVMETLPANWKNTSNFNCLSDAEVADLSWAGYPDRFLVVVQTPQPQYDSSTQRLESDYHFDGESVSVVWTIKSLDPVELQTQQENSALRKWEDIRVERDSLLAACDWTQLRDCRLLEEKVEEWATYRQALRDLPQSYSTPDEVVFPHLPL